jgi:hypothetical protein
MSEYRIALLRAALSVSSRLSEAGIDRALYSPFRFGTNLFVKTAGKTEVDHFLWLIDAHLNLWY